MPDTPSLLICATYRLQPGDVEAFRSLASRMADAANARDGCVFLHVAQDIGDPATFRLFEGWRDQTALDAHTASNEFQAVLREAATLGIVERSADIYPVSGEKALEMPSSSTYPGSNS